MSAPLNYAASQLWSFASLLARKTAKRTSLPARVISIGNIQIGGAGKTPLVAFTARQALEKGLRVCILCRGYGGEWERIGGVIAPQAAPQAQLLNGQHTGDEAALLHDLVPGAWIGIGADRVSSFEEVLKQAQAIDLVILDDGFQNHKIKKDLDIVALTSFGRTQRVYRDFQGSLSHADLVVWTKGDREPDARGRPKVRAHLELLAPEKSWDAQWILVSGVAESDLVRLEAERVGYVIKNHIRFPDHARYAEKLVSSIMEDARSAHCKILITGKDWVKWREIVQERQRSLFQVIEPVVRFSSEDLKTWNRVLWNT